MPQPHGQSGLLYAGLVDLFHKTRDRYDAQDMRMRRAHSKADYGYGLARFYERHPKRAARHFAQLADIVESRIGLEDTIFPLTESGRKALYASHTHRLPDMFAPSGLAGLLFPTEPRLRDGMRAAQILAHPHFYALCLKHMGESPTERLYEALQRSLQTLPDEDLSAFYRNRVSQWQEHVGQAMMDGDFRCRLEDKPMGPSRGR